MSGTATIDAAGSSPPLRNVSTSLNGGGGPAAYDDYNDEDPDACEEHQLTEATERALARELHYLYFASDRSSQSRTFQHRGTTWQAGQSVGLTFKPAPLQEELDAQRLLALLPEPEEIAVLDFASGDGDQQQQHESFGRYFQEAWAESERKAREQDSGRQSFPDFNASLPDSIKEGAEPDTMASVLLREELDPMAETRDGDFSAQLHTLVNAIRSNTNMPNTTVGNMQKSFRYVSDAATAPNTPVPPPSSNKRKQSAAPSVSTPNVSTEGSNGGGGGTTASSASSGAGAGGVTIQLEKFGPWASGVEGDDKKLPQCIVWDYLQHSEELMPWWVRCSFRQAVRPWLLPAERYDVWLPDDLIVGMDEHQLQNYSIYSTLVSRVHWLQHLYEDHDKEERMPRAVRLQLALWIDSHQMLMIFIEETGSYRNQELMEEIGDHDPDPFIENKVGEEAARGITWFDLYCPSLRLVMHQGELPDLTCLMPIIKLWKDIPRDLVYSFEEDLRQFADLFSKAIPRPQQSRSMNNICARSVLQYPRIAECFRRMVFCSLGGLYDFPECGKVISHFYVRHELYRWLCMHPVGDDGLGTWFNGFVLEEIKDLIVNHGKKKRKKKAKPVPPEVAEGLVPPGPGQDPADPYGQPSKILVGYNNYQVSQGYSNMTTFVQFVMNEYLYLLISRLPSLEETMQELHWYRVIQRIYLDACDRMRLLQSQWFEPRPIISRMMNEYSVELFDRLEREGPDSDTMSGQEMLACLAKHYTPWLRWQLQEDIADGVDCSDRGGRHFQRYGLPYGSCGHLLWNQRLMTLLETILFLCRHYALKFCSRFMHLTFSETIVEQTGRLHVKQQTAAEAQGLPIAKGLWNSTLDIPESDRCFIDMVVRYFNVNLPGRQPSYEWMAPIFGLDFYPLLMLRLAEHYYDLEVFRQAAVNVLQAMLTTHPREFFYVQYLMQQIGRADAICVYPLPINVKRQQEEALRRRFEGMTGFQVAGQEGSEDLPYLWDVVKYCEQHLDLKHCLVDDHPYKGTQAGVINVVTDPATGGLWCSTNLLKANRAPKLDPSPWIRRAGIVFDKDNRRLRLNEDGECEDKDPRKRMWSGWLNPPPPPAAVVSNGADARQKARCVFALYAEKTERINCQLYRYIREEHLCGNALRLGNRIHVLCPRCAGITLHQPNKFGNRNHGFLCPTCHEECKDGSDAAMVVTKDTSRQLYYHCFFCPYDRWVACQKVHRVQMLDDLFINDQERSRFRWVYFCDKHMPPYLGCNGTSIRLSTAVLVHAKRITPYPIRGSTSSGPPQKPKPTTTPHITQWDFITNKNESRFWKSFGRTSRRLSRIHQRMDEEGSSSGRGSHI